MYYICDRIILLKKKETLELFSLVLEDKFRSSKNSKFHKLKEIKIEIDKIEKDQNILTEKLISGVVSDKVYSNFNSKCEKSLIKLRIQESNLNDYGKDLTKYINSGISILENIKNLFINGTVEVKQKLLSSILNEKLVFSDKKYRTPKFKEGFEFI